MKPLLTYMRRHRWKAGREKLSCEEVLKERGLKEWMCVTSRVRSALIELSPLSNRQEKGPGCVQSARAVKPFNA